MPTTGPARRIIGITGPPGVGKTTYAVQVATDLGGVHLPMDGFHLADVSLERLGLRERKGAPETFDAWGFAALLARLRPGPPRSSTHRRSSATSSSRWQGRSRWAESADVIVTEGNYLLLDAPEWRAVRARIDEIWYLDQDDDLRHERLVERHVRFGKTLDQARAWVARVDDVNATLIASTKTEADRVIDLRDGS